MNFYAYLYLYCTTYYNFKNNCHQLNVSHIHMVFFIPHIMFVHHRLLEYYDNKFKQSRNHVPKYLCIPSPCKRLLLLKF